MPIKSVLKSKRRKKNAKLPIVEEVTRRSKTSNGFNPVRLSDTWKKRSLATRIEPFHMAIAVPTAYISNANSPLCPSSQGDGQKKKPGRIPDWVFKDQHSKPVSTTNIDSEKQSVQQLPTSPLMHNKTNGRRVIPVRNSGTTIMQEFFSQAINPDLVMPINQITERSSESKVVNLPPETTQPQKLNWTKITKKTQRNRPSTQIETLAMINSTGLIEGKSTRQNQMMITSISQPATGESSNNTCTGAMSIEETLSADCIDNKIKIIVSDTYQNKMLKSIASKEANSKGASLTKKKSQNYSHASLNRVNKAVTTQSKPRGQFAKGAFLGKHLHLQSALQPSSHPSSERDLLHQDRNQLSKEITLINSQQNSARRQTSTKRVGLGWRNTNRQQQQSTPAPLVINPSALLSHKKIVSPQALYQQLCRPSNNNLINSNAPPSQQYVNEAMDLNFNTEYSEHADKKAIPKMFKTQDAALGSPRVGHQKLQDMNQVKKVKSNSAHFSEDQEHLLEQAMQMHRLSQQQSKVLNEVQLHQVDPFCVSENQHRQTLEQQQQQVKDELAEIQHIQRLMSRKTNQGSTVSRANRRNVTELSKTTNLVHSNSKKGQGHQDSMQQSWLPQTQQFINEIITKTETCLGPTQLMGMQNRRKPFQLKPRTTQTSCLNTQGNNALQGSGNIQESALSGDQAHQQFNVLQNAVNQCFVSQTTVQQPKYQPSWPPNEGTHNKSELLQTGILIKGVKKGLQPQIGRNLPQETSQTIQEDLCTANLPQRALDSLLDRPMMRTSTGFHIQQRQGQSRYLCPSLNSQQNGKRDQNNFPGLTKSQLHSYLIQQVGTVTEGTAPAIKVVNMLPSSFQQLQVNAAYQPQLKTRKDSTAIDEDKMITKFARQQIEQERVQKEESKAIEDYQRLLQRQIERKRSVGADPEYNSPRQQNPIVFSASSTSIQTRAKNSEPVSPDQIRFEKLKMMQIANSQPHQKKLQLGFKGRLSSGQQVGNSGHMRQKTSTLSSQDGKQDGNTDLAHLKSVIKKQVVKFYQQNLVHDSVYLRQKGIECKGQTIGNLLLSQSITHSLQEARKQHHQKNIILQAPQSVLHDHHKLSAIGRNSVAPINMSQPNGSPTAASVLVKLPTDLQLVALNDRKLRANNVYKKHNQGVSAAKAVKHQRTSIELDYELSEHRRAPQSDVNLFFSQINEFVRVTLKYKETITQAHLAQIRRLGRKIGLKFGNVKELDAKFINSKDFVAILKSKVYCMLNAVVMRASETGDAQQQPEIQQAQKTYKFYVEPNGNNHQIVRSVIKRRSWYSSQELSQEHGWSGQGPKMLNLIWTQVRRPRILRELQPYQIYNHMDGINQIAQKSLLFLNMQNYYKAKGLDVFDYMPETYLVPSTGSFELNLQYKAFKVACQTNISEPLSKQQQLWIFKPGESTNRGHGIRVFNDYEKIRQHMQEFCRNAENRRGQGRNRNCIIQRYIMRPLLINRRKFDIRVFALMVCHADTGLIRGYFYDEGYLRTSSKDFNIDKWDNRVIHLTNDAVQKNSADYGKYESANKISYHDFEKHLLKEKNVSFIQTIVPKIKDMVTDVMEATGRTLYRPAQSQEGVSRSESAVDYNGFELLGFDFMLDSNLKLDLIEVNTNPCLDTPCMLLQRIIPTVLDQTLKIAVDPFLQANEHQYYMTQDLPVSEMRFSLVYQDSMAFAKRDQSNHDPVAHQGVKMPDINPNKDDVPIVIQIEDEEESTSSRSTKQKPDMTD